MGKGPRKPCTVDGCTNLTTPGGGRWCRTHQWRWKHYRDLDHVRRVTPAEERFRAKVDRSGACWLWTAGTDKDGYGLFRVADCQMRAHRFSFELHCGPIPPGMVVMHSCDVPLCVNPAHLELGTHAQNAADSARKARRPRGSRNPQSKLTEGQVLEVRARYAAGGVTHARLAADYGISTALVSFIVNRKAWRHI